MDEFIDHGEKIVSKAYNKQTSKLPKGVRRRVDSVRDRVVKKYNKVKSSVKSSKHYGKVDKAVKKARQAYSAMDNDKLKTAVSVFKSKYQKKRKQSERIEAHRKKNKK
jgi:biotin carboxylase